ncbi:adenine nucleotide alpha hydrolase [bacterium SM23_31]|nr:MAG: adenine nucleotide alpha hydrolase [bacterium SM23_31]
MDLDEKYKKLQNILREMGGVVIGFSGGVDSTFLLKVAADVLHEKALGLIAVSNSFPERELMKAKKLGEQIGARIRVVQTEEHSNPQYINNPVNRCYFCRTELFGKMAGVAEEEGITFLADGANIDDISDYRPGEKAREKYSVRSPLREAGLRKDEIRALSRRLGLPTYNKSSLACLASRIPYGSRITPEKLRMIDLAENYLTDLGFNTVRVRHYDTTARIELDTHEFSKMMDETIRKKIVRKLKEIGYIYVTLDLEGFRSGSMNEVLINEDGRLTVKQQ